ncbi:MAG: hypothetical protein KAV87_09450 [Desulfobacteraceae bacterium]|nr:hypothetical protein [Desulfobacteraceae bacterium]
MNGLLTSWHEVTAIVLLITVINAGFVWAVKWLISSVLRDCSVKIIDLNKTSEALKDDLFSLKESLPRDYVRREDWIMGFAKIEQKIDAIWNYIHEK